MTQVYTIRGPNIFTLKSVAEGKPELRQEVKDWVADGMKVGTAISVGVFEISTNPGKV